MKVFGEKINGTALDVYMMYIGVGFARCTPSTRHKKVNLHVIFASYYPCKPDRAS